MYSYIKGIIADLYSDHIVIDNHGIGYEAVSYTHLTLPTIA